MDDSSSDQAFNQALALAEQDCGEDCVKMAVPPSAQLQTPDSDPAYPGVTNITTSVSSWMRNIEITAGTWFQLPIMDARYTTTQSTFVDNQKVLCMKDIPVTYLAGMPHINDTDLAVTNQSAIIDTSVTKMFGDQSLRFFAWNKWNGSQIHLTDFLVTVERDASGGVQMKDNLMFEIMDLPVLADGNTQSGEINEDSPFLIPTVLTQRDGNFKMTDLSKGLHYKLAGSSGWGIPTDFISTAIGASATNPRWRSRLFWEWHSKSSVNNVEPVYGIYDPNDSPNIGLIPRHISLDFPYFVRYIRCINVPAVTNIKIFLSYRWELVSQWQGMFKDITYSYPFIDQDGSVRSLTNKRTVKKRKINEIEGLNCFISQIYNNYKYYHHMYMYLEYFSSSSEVA